MKLKRTSKKIIPYKCKFKLIYLSLRNYGNKSIFSTINLINKNKKTILTENFRKTPVINAIKAPIEAFNLDFKSDLFILSPINAPIIDPNRLPIIPKKTKPKINPIVHPKIPFFEPPNFFAPIEGSKKSIKKIEIEIINVKIIKKLDIYITPLNFKIKKLTQHVKGAGTIGVKLPIKPIMQNNMDRIIMNISIFF